MRIGILGTGAIGTEVARWAHRDDQVEGLFLYDIRTEAASRLAAELDNAVVVDDADALIAASDLIVEAATAEAARDVVPKALEAKKDVLMMSIGALVDDAFHDEVRKAAKANGVKVYLPSGAIAGIDGVKAGKLGGIKSVTLVTTKPPEGLGVAVDKWTLLFSGPAREAIRLYPKNVNVAVCLSLAGLGPDETWVQVVADPMATRNQHKIIVEGEFGRIRAEIENLPHPDNPKTSYLASLSAIATLKRILEPIQIGA